MYCKFTVGTIFHCTIFTPPGNLLSPHHHTHRHTQTHTDTHTHTHTHTHSSVGQQLVVLNVYLLLCRDRVQSALEEDIMMDVAVSMIESMCVWLQYLCVCVCVCICVCVCVC